LKLIESRRSPNEWFVAVSPTLALSFGIVISGTNFKFLLITSSLPRGAYQAESLMDSDAGH
jgi:hypothetical protein